MFRGFNPFVTAPIPIDSITNDDDSDDDLDDMDDPDDHDDHDSAAESGHLYVDSRLFASRARHGRHGSVSPTASLKEKFEQFWTALLLAKPPNAPESGTTTTRDKTAPKVLFLKDIADIIHTSFGSVLIPSLTNAVLTLRKAGHNIMIVAGHSPSLLTARNTDSGTEETSADLTDAGSFGLGSSSDVSLITVIQKLKSPSEHGHHHHHHSSHQGSPQSLASLIYDNFPGPTQTFHHISIPPFLPSPPSSASVSIRSTDCISTEYALQNEELLRKDRADRIREINCRNMAAVLRFRGGAIAEQTSAEDVFGGLRSIDSEVWGFGKVYRVISNALGSLYLEHQDENRPASTVLSKQDVEKAMVSLTVNSNLRKQLASLDWSGKKKPAKPLIRAEDCNRYERKLLQTIVDPGNMPKLFFFYIYIYTRHLFFPCADSFFSFFVLLFY